MRIRNPWITIYQTKAHTSDAAYTKTKRLSAKRLNLGHILRPSDTELSPVTWTLPGRSGAGWPWTRRGPGLTAARVVSGHGSRKGLRSRDSRCSKCMPNHQNISVSNHACMNSGTQNSRIPKTRTLKCDPKNKTPHFGWC